MKFCKYLKNKFYYYLFNYYMHNVYLNSFILDINLIVVFFSFFIFLRIQMVKARSLLFV
jgi:hypothetical protein